MKLRIALFILSVAAMAAFGLFTQVKAGEDRHMVYGLGGEPCGTSLKHDWMKYGEAAWISGFMSMASELAPRRDMDPFHPTAKTLLALVYYQCKHDPSLTIGDATDTIAARILTRQRADRPQQQEEVNPNESLEQAPM
jgi:hypothetical protein